MVGKSSLTSDELLDALRRFHREEFVPDFKKLFDGQIGALRLEMRERFEALYELFDRLHAAAAEFDARPTNHE